MVKVVARLETHSWLQQKLCDMERGDVRAAHDVMNFFAKRLSDVTILYRNLPEMPLSRVDALRREVERVSEFLYGYSEAQVASAAAKPKQSDK